MSRLTQKQAAFVREYLVDLNATQAAIRAGYSQRTANEQGARLLTKVSVQTAVSIAMAERAAQVNYTAESVLQRHIEIDRLDVLDILNEQGAIKPLREWPAAWRKTVSGFEIMELGTNAILKKIKLPDKLRNLELLGKHVNVQAYGEPKSATTDLVDALGQLITGMPD